MTERARNIGSLLLYGASGLSAIVLAAWLSGQFTSHAFSQAPSEPPSVGQPPPAAAAPPAPPPAAPAAEQPPAQAPQVVDQNSPSGFNPPPPLAPATNMAPNFPTSPQTLGVPQVGTQITTVPGKSIIKTVGAPGESKIPDILVGIIEDYNYSPAGKRDPFTPFERSTNNTSMGPIWPLQKYDLEQLKLVGVIWEVKIPKAMILDPSGHGYVVTVNERIGRNNGYIARIREGEIVVVENVLGADGKSAYVTKLMKLNPQ